MLIIAKNLLSANESSLIGKSERFYLREDRALIFLAYLVDRQIFGETQPTISIFPEESIS